MARIPQGLLYLTIYNPTLKPSVPHASDDEDAEEQAHILFYTARERAVSRDRMLRQVGLAKALVNFSSMFSYEASSSNIHSQSRRMVVVCPEPGFFIHACFELARSPRAPPEKGSDKDKQRAAGKVKDAAPPPYDHHDGSIDDAALQAHLYMAYEQFKVTHGSFTSILAILGQQALELQLERFFTVWAWKWDVEDGFEFVAQLGVPLHPAHRSLQPALDAFCFNVEDDAIPFLIHAPHYIPSSRCADANFPTSLPRHFLSLFPAPRPRPPRKSSSVYSASTARVINTWAGPPTTLDLAPTASGDETIKATDSQAVDDGPSNFLGMRAMNMNMNMNLNMDVMDVRKWNWGALTFGKGLGRKGQRLDVAQESSSKGAASSEPPTSFLMEDREESGAEKPIPEPAVDKAALDDAMATESTSDNVVSDPASTLPQDESRETGAVPDDKLAEAAGDSPETGALERLQLAEATSDKLPPPVVPVNASLPERLLPHPPAPESLTLPMEHSAETESAMALNEADFTDRISLREMEASPSPPLGVLLSQSAPSSVLDSEVSSLAPSTLSSAFQGSPAPSSPIPSPALSSTSVYLANSEKPLETARRRVMYLTKGHFVCVVVRSNGEDLDEDQKGTLSIHMSSLLDELASAMAVEEAKSRASMEDSLATAAKILKPRDKHLVLTGHGTTMSTTGFTSKAGPMFAAHQRLVNDPAMLEVFSRGQNPQHWHVAHRGLVEDDEVGNEEGSVYLEVMRKESSLTDVDNEMAGILRRYSEQLSA